MKQSLFLLFWLCAILALKAQNSDISVDSIINEAITKHDLGQYSEAILLFKKALKMEPKSSRAAYELSYTYYTVKDYDKSIRMARQSLTKGDQQLPEAYIVWGSALDEWNKSRQALRVYSEGLIRFPDNYLILYNQGLTYYRLKRFGEAEKSFSTALETNPTHPGSHLMLGLTENALDKKLEALLALNIFLVLEPVSDRSDIAWENLASLQARLTNMIRNPQIENQTFLQDSSGMDDLLIRISSALSGIPDMIAKDSSSMAIFSWRNEKILELIPEKMGTVQNIWNQLYFPFFNRLCANNNVVAYNYYISQGARTQESRDWFANHKQDGERFAHWFQNQEFLK